MEIGVLALQGAFAKHIARFQSLGVETSEVRRPEELNNCAALVIPGGESTTMLRQMEYIKLTDRIREFAKEKPVFGTCAGLVLMANEIIGNIITPLKLIDITVERNAYGRQVDSFTGMIHLQFNKQEISQFHAIFIRAPQIRKWGSKVQVLASFDNEPVLVKQGIHLAAAFHPELVEDYTLHQYFINIVKENEII
jgi:5'-phosphate synthase pdxT subunit